MVIGFTVRPRVLFARTPTGGDINLAEAVARYLATMEEELAGSVRDKMRRGVSTAEISEQGSVTTQLTGPPRPRLRVYSRPVKSGDQGSSAAAAVDETGRVPGSFPPFGPGSMLLEWARFWFPDNPRHAAFNIARAINERGLPRSGDPLRQPFRTTHMEFEQEIRRGLREARAEAVRRTNAPSK